MPYLLPAVKQVIWVWFLLQYPVVDGHALVSILVDDLRDRTVGIHGSQGMERESVALFGSQLEEPLRLGVILLDTFTIEVTMTQVVLRIVEPSFGCQLPIPHGFREIGGDIVAIVVNQP